MIIEEKTILDQKGREFFRYMAFCYTPEQNNRLDHIELKRKLAELLKSDAPNIALGLENVDNLIAPTKTIIVGAQKDAAIISKTYHIITNTTSTMYEQLEDFFKEKIGKGAFARITETSKKKELVFLHKGYSSFEKTIEDYFTSRNSR
jgi:hypothetical protein